MRALLSEIRHNPLLWLLVFVPAVLVGAKLKPEAHTVLFALSVLALMVYAIFAITLYLLPPKGA